MKQQAPLSWKTFSLAIGLGLIQTIGYAAEPTLQPSQSAETKSSNLFVINILSNGQTYSVEVNFADPVLVKQAIDKLVQQAGADSSDAITQQFIDQAQVLAQSDELALLSPSIEGQTIPILVDINNQTQIDSIATQLGSLGLDSSHIESVLTSAGISPESIDTALNTSDTGEDQQDSATSEDDTAQQSVADSDQPDVGDIEPSAGRTQPLGAKVDVNLPEPAASVISELQVVNDQFDVSPQ